MIGYSEQEFYRLKKFLLTTPKRQSFMSRDEILKKYKCRDDFDKQLNLLLDNKIVSFFGNNNHTLTIRLASNEELKKEYEYRLKEKGSRAEIAAYNYYHEYDHVVSTLKKYGNIYVGDVDDRVMRQVNSICNDYSIRPVSDRVGYIITIPSKYVEHLMLEEKEEEEEYEI